MADKCKTCGGGRMGGGFQQALDGHYRDMYDEQAQEIRASAREDNVELSDAEVKVAVSYLICLRSHSSLSFALYIENQRELSGNDYFMEINAFGWAMRFEKAARGFGAS